MSSLETLKEKMIHLRNERDEAIAERDKAIAQMEEEVKFKTKELIRAQNEMEEKYEDLKIRNQVNINIKFQLEGEISKYQK